MGMTAMAMVESGLRKASVPEPQTHFGALVLDGRGVILKCSDAAAQLFGGEFGDLVGNTVSSFITNLLPSDASPSYNARYVAYLSNSGLWRRFQAVDLHGQHFPIELTMSRLTAEVPHVLLLHIRLPAME